MEIDDKTTAEGRFCSECGIDLIDTEVDVCGSCKDEPTEEETEM